MQIISELLFILVLVHTKEAIPVYLNFISKVSPIYKYNFFVLCIVEQRNDY